MCAKRGKSVLASYWIADRGGADGRIDLFLSACTACGVSPRVFVNGRDGS